YRAGRTTRALQRLPVVVARNRRWQEGMGTSIRAGLRAMREHGDALRAVVLMPCDLPLITARDLDALIRLYAVRRSVIVASAYAGTHGTPALFDQSLFGELESLPAAGG